MFEQLEAVRARYEAITDRLSDPAVHADLKELQRLGKEQAQLRDLVQLYSAYRRAERGMEEARELAEHERDPEMQAYARQEFEKQQAERDRLESELNIALVPKDPTDDKDVIVEIRQGTGGDEAGLFAADLFRMYSRYAESRRWKVDLLSENVTERGGFKEVVFEVRGHGAFSRLKFENGVHRVQRVPETEAQGRIHTSTATVVVMPERSMSPSIRNGSRSMSTVPADTAGRASIPRTRPCASPTRPRTAVRRSWSPARMSARN